MQQVRLNVRQHLLVNQTFLKSICFQFCNDKNNTWRYNDRDIIITHDAEFAIEVNTENMKISIFRFH